MSQQLVKKGANGGYSNVMPKSWIEAIKDKNTGKTLVEILQSFNMYFLPYDGNSTSTRCLVPTMLRKKGLWITYVKYDGNVHTEWYAADEIDDKSWGDSSNWRIGNNTLVGDITISANGNWVINGTETEFKAVGEKGNTPLIRVANNRLQVSYDLGDTYMNVTENPVYTQFRNHNNKIQVSTDLGATWTDVSDEIAAYFRWQATAGDTQANNVGRVQISRDNKTWVNLSNDIINNLHISRYIGVNESLPTSGIAEGTIYAKGPYYAEDDTLNDNPIYRMWIYAWKGNTLAWQDNGEFTSIVAGVVQETGNSETEVMSQKAVSAKLSELGSEVNTSYSATNSIIENLISTSNPQFELASFEQISNKFLDEQGDVQDIDNSAYTIQKISVAEGDIYKIKGETSPSHLCTWALYNGETKVFYQSASGKVQHIVIPKGVDTLYVQNVNSIDEQYKMIKWDIAFDTLINAFNTTMVGFNVLAKMFGYYTSSVETITIERTFFNTQGKLENIQNDAYSVIYTNVSEGDILLIEAVVSPVTQPKYVFYKGEEVKFYYIDSVYQNTYFVVVPNGVDTIFVQQVNNVGSIKKVQLQNDASSALEERVDNIDKKVSLFEIAQSNEENVTASCEIEDNTYIDITATKGEYANIALWTLPVKEGEKYRITKAYSWLMFRAYLIADSNGNIMEYMPNAEDSAATYRDYEITIPKGATILYIHHNSGSVKETNIYKITEFSVPSKSLSLKGKKWVCIGDSLTESNLRATKNYHDYVADATGIEVVNMGRSGTGYARTRDEGFAFFQRALNIPQDADVITIFGSGNDLGAGLPLGEPTDTSDTESLCGYIHRTIDVIQTSFPLIPFGVITPTPWIGLEPSQAPNNMSKYSDAIVAICKIRGVPCFDLYYCSNLHPSNATFRELAYSRDEGNGVHPDENGHKLIAPRFKAFLETLVL